MSSLETQAGELFDFLASRMADGATWEDARDEFEWAKARSHFFHVVRKLRIIMGDDDNLTVICDPRGARQTWLYRITGDPQQAYAWQANRIGDSESRLETILAVSRSVARNADGRTLAGKKARKIESTVGYLLHELGDLRDEEG